MTGYLPAMEGPQRPFLVNGLRVIQPARRELLLRWRWAVLFKAMPPPGVAGLQDRPGLLDGFQGPERLTQDRPLLRHVAGISQGMPKGVAKIEGARRLDLARDLFLQ